MIDPKQIIEQFKNLNPRDVGTWPLAPRLACLIAIIVGVIAAGWIFYWDGLQEELKVGQADEAKLKEEFRGKLQQAVNLEPLKKQKAQISLFVLTLEKQLPSRAEMDALLSDINQAGVGRGLQFELFRPGGVTVRDYYAELPITIRVTGSYHDIGAFTSDIANLPRIVTLNNLVVTMPGGNPAALALDATAKTFRYLDPDEVAAQKRGKK